MAAVPDSAWDSGITEIPLPPEGSVHRDLCKVALLTVAAARLRALMRGVVGISGVRLFLAVAAVA